MTTGTYPSVRMTVLTEGYVPVVMVLTRLIHIVIFVITGLPDFDS